MGQGSFYKSSSYLRAFFSSASARPGSYQTLQGSTRSNLILLTAHPDPELIFFSYAEFEGGSAELTVNKQLQLYERTPRQAEFFNDILVHPSGKLVVVSCYTGKLKIITFKASGRLDQEFDVSCVLFYV